MTYILIILITASNGDVSMSVSNGFTTLRQCINAGNAATSLGAEHFVKISYTCARGSGDSGL